MLAEPCQAPSTEETSDALARRFDAPFLRWRRDGDKWDCIDHAELIAAGAWLTALDAVAAAEAYTPVVTAVDCSTLVIAVRTFDELHNSIVVAGVVRADARRLANQLASEAIWSEHGSQERAERQLLLDSYAGKLADSFEELSFLRRLSQQVEYCDATNSLEDVARSIVPSLRELMGIEGLALFTAEHAEGGRPRVAALAVSDGKLRAAEDDWFHAIETLTHAQPGIIVKNFAPIASRVAANAPLGRVRSVVISPIAKDQTVYGWLVGVNKKYVVEGEAGPANSLGFDEIGTMEASLLQSATVLLATHAANVRLFRDNEQLVVDAIHTLVGVIEAKDAYTCGHSDRVALVARRIAQQMGLPESQCHDIYLSGLLHDIGKVGVSDDVLLKPGRLENHEFAQIKRHPQIGWRLLQRLKPLERLLPAVLHHHESVDGSGYPNGLKGDEIPQAARILAVADAWDAMTSNRPYRAGMPREKAEAILRDGAGKQWDAEAVEAFIAAREDVEQVTRTWEDHLENILEPQWAAEHVTRLPAPAEQRATPADAPPLASASAGRDL